MWAYSLDKSFLQLYLYSIHTQRVRLFLLFVWQCDTFSRVRVLLFAYTALVERQPQLQRTQQQVILWNWISLRGPNIESNLFFYICPVVLLCIASVVFYFSFHFILSALSSHLFNLKFIHCISFWHALSIDLLKVSLRYSAWSYSKYDVSLVPHFSRYWHYFSLMYMYAFQRCRCRDEHSTKAITTKKSVNKRRELNWKRLILLIFWLNIVATPDRSSS